MQASQQLQLQQQVVKAKCVWSFFFLKIGVGWWEEEEEEELFVSSVKSIEIVLG